MAEEEVQAIIAAQVELGSEAVISKDLAKFDAFCAKFWVAGWKIIRPSGNAIDYEGYKKMLVDENIKMMSTELVEINSTKVLANGMAAVAVYTTHDKFEYKGTPNEDIAVTSAMLEKTKEGWKFVHMHRTTKTQPRFKPSEA